MVAKLENEMIGMGEGAEVERGEETETEIMLTPETETMGVIVIENGIATVINSGFKLWI